MSKWFTFAVLFLAPHLTGAAESTSQAFCDRPYEAICGENDADAKARAEHLEIKLKAAQRLALSVVKRKFPQLRRNDLTVESLAKLQDRKLRDQAMAVYYETLLKSVRKHLGNASLVTHLHFERVKNRLRQAIQAHATISKEETRDMIKQLDSSEVVDALDVLLSKTDDQELRDAVIESCNRDGLEENAFADVVAKKNYVIVCPGDYLAGFDRSERHLRPSEMLQANEVWTLGHETGHHVDATDHPIMYENMRACLAENHAAELKGPVADYMSEITADHWGNEELASYLARFKTATARFAALKQSMISLCDSEDDGTHPEGRFRIEMLRRNPRIHKIMGCLNPDQSAVRREDATCTVRGKGEIVLWPPRKMAPVVNSTSFDSDAGR